MKIKNLVQTCNACPSQWDAETLDGENVYIRYRWGHLTLDIANKTAKSLTIGNCLDGFMSEEEMLRELDLEVL